MTARYTYSLNPDVEERLAKMASDTHRSKSGMIEYLIEKEWSQIAPYLKSETTNTVAAD